MSENTNTPAPAPTPAAPPPVTPPPALPPRKAFDFAGFINFRTMITPTIIKIIYVIGSALLALGLFISGIIMMLPGGVMILAGFMSIIIGIPVSLVVFRVYCELLSLFFSIHGELKELNNKK